MIKYLITSQPLYRFLNLKVSDIRFLRTDKIKTSETIALTLLAPFWAVCCKENKSKNDLSTGHRKDDICLQDTAKMIFSSSVSGHLFLFLSAKVSYL